MPEVVLACMPFVDLHRPSLALSLLKALLAREGIDASVYYGNLAFAEIGGIEKYEALGDLSATLLAGELVFAAATFPEKETGGTAIEELLRRRERPRLAEDVAALRAEAAGFLDRAAAAILEMGPRVVGCTSTFQQHVAALGLLRRVKVLDPGVVTMMGGANCEGLMGLTTHHNFAWVDYVVSGDADHLIGPLCRRALEVGAEIGADELPAEVLAPVHRLSGYRRDERFPDGVARGVFGALETLPHPDFSDYFSRIANWKFRPALQVGLPMETSRGCWWGAVHHCTFCGLNGGGMSFRAKSAARVLTELRAITGETGVDGVEIVDNILDMKYFQTLLPRLAASGNGTRLFFETKSNLKRTQVEALAAAGIRWVQPGIESLSTEVLELMDKGAKASTQVLMLKWAREFGVRVSWSLLAGFPGENDAWYEEMATLIPLLEHLPPPTGVVRVRFDRYSPYHMRPAEFGLRLQPVPMMKHIYPLSADDLADQAYFFVDADDERSARGFVRRPGVGAVRRAADAWRAAFFGRRRPQLVMHEEGNRLRLSDTRACAVLEHTILDGLERAVYLACVEGAGTASLRRLLPAGDGEGTPPEAADQRIEATLDRLRAARLLVTLDGRHISLALPADIAPYPPGTDFPGGWVDVRKARRIEAESSVELLELLLS
jgi:ribosomal peptide maturation radical SAM protein 1